MREQFQRLGHVAAHASGITIQDVSKIKPLVAPKRRKPTGRPPAKHISAKNSAELDAKVKKNERERARRQQVSQGFDAISPSARADDFTPAAGSSGRS